jgi:predicted nucleotidyltransferase
MDLAGLRLAFDHALSVEIEPGFTVRVAPREVVAVLKMAAYMDRPHDRERDLDDIAYILNDYVGDDDDRRFGEDVLDLQLGYDEVSPFLLGKRLATITNERERAIVRKFTTLVRSEDNPSNTQARMVAAAPPGWRGDPSEMLNRIAAFERGFGPTERRAG